MTSASASFPALMRQRTLVAARPQQRTGLAILGDNQPSDIFLVLQQQVVELAQHSGAAACRRLLEVCECAVGRRDGLLGVLLAALDGRAEQLAGAGVCSTLSAVLCC